MFKKILKSILCVLIFGFLFQVSGCKNFMQGNQVLSEINDTISYENAPYVNASIVKENLDDTGTLEPSGKVSDAKVGFPFSISYTPSSNYYFEKWQALDENNNPVSDKIVHFENPNNIKTEVTINTKEYIKIQAINKTTPRVNIKLSVNLADSGKINLEKIDLEEGESKEIRFIENERFQFIKWECSNSDVIIDDKKSIDTVVSSKVSKKTGSFSAEIVAVCAERPQVVSSNTMNQTETFYKNTSITINFNKQLSAKNDLSDIKLIYSGIELLYGDTEAFNEPYFYDDGEKINYSVVIIPANKNHSLNVEQTGQIKVEIPEDFYYEDVNNKNEKILFGEKFSWVYKINNETNEKTNIQLEYNSDHGKIIEGASGTYNIGKTLQYSYEVNDDSMFIGWEIIQAPINIINISDSQLTSKTISFTTINNGDVTVKAKTVKRPALDENFTITPTNKENGVEIDSDVSMKFNCAVNVDALINNINIECDDEDISDFFDITFDTSTNKLELSASKDPDKIIDLKNKLEPTENKTKKVKITISKNDIFFYSGGTKVSAVKDIEYKYAINNKTTKYTTIKIIKNTAFGNYSGNESGTYYLGDTISLIFTENKNYQFNEFSIIQKNSEGTDSIKINDNEQTTNESGKKELNATVINPGTVEISVDAVERIQVDESAIKPKYIGTGVSKDTSIHIYFTKPVDKSQFEDSNINLIKITDASGLTDFTNLNFYKPEISNDGKEIFIQANFDNLIDLQGANLREIVITINKELKDSKQESILGKDFIYHYVINKDKDYNIPVFTECLILNNYVMDDESGKSFTENENKLIFTNNDAGEQNIDKITELDDLRKYSFNDYVYIYLNTYDIGSGLNEITVKETKIKTLNGTSLEVPIDEETVHYINPKKSDINENSNNILYWQKIENNLENQENHKIIIKHKLTSDEGIIKLTIKAYDNEYNVSEGKTISLIHNKQINKDNWIITNAPEENVVSSNNYIEQISKLRWYSLSQFIYKDFQLPDSEFNCKLKINDNYVNEINYDETNNYWYADISSVINSNNEIKIELTVETKTDDYEQTETKDYIIPQKTNILASYKIEGSNENKVIVEQNYLSMENKIIAELYTNTNNSFLKILETNNINNITTSSELNENNYLFIYYNSTNTKLYSGITSFTVNSITLTEKYDDYFINNLKLENITLSEITQISSETITKDNNILFFTILDKENKIIGNYTNSSKICIPTLDFKLNEKLIFNIHFKNNEYKNVVIDITNLNQKIEDIFPPKVIKESFKYNKEDNKNDEHGFLYYIELEVEDTNEIDPNKSFYYYTNRTDITDRVYNNAIDAGKTYKPIITKTDSNLYTITMYLRSWFDVLHYRYTLSDKLGNTFISDEKEKKFPEVDLFFSLNSKNFVTLYTNEQNCSYTIYFAGKTNLKLPIEGLQNNKFTESTKEIKGKKYNYYLDIPISTKAPGQSVGPSIFYTSLNYLQLHIVDAEGFEFIAPYKCLNLANDADHYDEILDTGGNSILVQSYSNIYYKLVYSNENFGENFFEWESSGFVLTDEQINLGANNSSSLKIFNIDKETKNLASGNYYTILFYFPYNEVDFYSAFQMLDVRYKE